MKKKKVVAMRNYAQNLGWVENNSIPFESWDSKRGSLRKGLSLEEGMFRTVQKDSAPRVKIP